MTLDLSMVPNEVVADCRRVEWWLVAGKYWISSVAKPHETAQDTLVRMLCNPTDLLCTKPSHITPGSWSGLVRYYSIHQPQHTRNVSQAPL